MVACSRMFLEFLYRNQLVLAVIVVVLVVRLLIGKLPKRYAYLLWAVVGLRMIVGIYYPSVFSLFNLVRVPEQVWSGQESSLLAERLSPREGEGVTAEGLLAAGAEAGVSEAAEEMETLLAEPGLLAHGETVPFWQMACFLCFLIWMIGVGGMFCYGLVSYIRCRRMVREAVRQEENVWECQNLPSPFVLGLLRPRIYLPFHLPEEERRYILEHERCHIRRKDPLAKLIAFALLAVYWINPLAWLSYFLMAQDMEMSCDEAVLRKLGAGIKKGYSTSLLSFAVGKRNVAALSLAFGESPSSKRIRHVLHYQKPKRIGGIVGVLAIVAVAVVCLTSSAGAKAGRSQFYAIRPELFSDMELTYPEYQKLTGEEMEFYHGGFFIGPLPDTTVELIMRGEYDEETAGFSLDETARFIRLQGKLSDILVLPEEDLGRELSWEELLEHLAEQSGAPLSTEYLEGGGTAYYVANYYVRVGLDCDRDGTLDTSLDIEAGWEDWAESVNSDTTVWLTRILQESP